MLVRATAWVLTGLLLSWSAPLRAQEEVPIDYRQTLALAHQYAPEWAAAHGREAVAGVEVRVAGVYPNPTLLLGTSTQTAKVSATASIPLVILGQRKAALEASRADLTTARVDTEATWNEVRTATAHGFVTLWLAQRTAEVRVEAAAIAHRLDEAVAGRVQLGAAPQVEGLRAHTERLRGEADAQEAQQHIAAAASELGRWLGLTDGSLLRAKGDPEVPSITPPLGSLMAQVGVNPSVRRENAEAQAAEARAARERAYVRPTLTLDLGVDAFDPTITPAATNYRAQIGLDLPLANQRGPYIERERLAASVARTRSYAERIRLSAELSAAYRTWEALSTRQKAFAENVLPNAEAAARAIEESYTLGRSSLVAMLDAERARVDTKLSLFEASAARANAWIDVQHALGGP